MLIIRRASVCALWLAYGLLCAPQWGRAAEPIYFDVDPTQSIISMTASIQIPDFGVTIATVGQGTAGLGVPWFGDGTTGRLDGILAAQVDWSNQTMQFGGSSIYGLPSGLWEPAALGENGLDSAFVGVYISRILGLPAQAVAAVRNFWLDYRDAYTITNLDPTTDGYQFTSDHWLAVTAQVDLRGKTGIAVNLGHDRLELNDSYGAHNVGQLGQLTPLNAGAWQVEIPVSTSVFIDAGQVDGLGPVYVSLNFQGQLVGQSIDLTTDLLVIPSLPGNDTLTSAQSVDWAFNREYHPDIGNRTLNTSAAAKHVTIEGLGDGTLDYFSFQVWQPHSLAIFDIDGGTFDSVIYLYDADGNLLAWNDDAPSNHGARGSLSSLDAFLEYTFAQPGKYYLAVGGYAGGALAGVPEGGEYRLHITVVPEPATATLSMVGVAGALLLQRRRRLPRAPVLLALALAMLPNWSHANPLVKNSIEAVYDANGQYPMGYRLFAPENAGSAGEQVPLVLFMHGAGERGDDNYYQVTTHIDGLIRATQGSEYTAFLLAPQVTDYPFAGGWNSNSPFDRTIEILNHVIENYPVDINRIYITGLSMGGYGTFTYMAQHPNLFAAAVPLSGGGSPSTAALIKDIPTWVFHGALDAVVSVNQSRNMVNAITAAGGSPIYTELPNGQHDIWGPIYNDAELGQYGLYDWMFAQSKSAVMTVPEPSGIVLALVALLLVPIALRKS